MNATKIPVRTSNSPEIFTKKKITHADLSPIFLSYHPAGRHEPRETQSNLIIPGSSACDITYLGRRDGVSFSFPKPPMMHGDARRISRASGSARVNQAPRAFTQSRAIPTDQICRHTHALADVCESRFHECASSPSVFLFYPRVACFALWVSYFQLIYLYI